ncbi:MAG: UDP-N-acetylmuramoyl-L-alanyl-D-glutamate--2,6-diaminopimelate ligase [Candidatus Omnitrophica bacterium]|nr:UDP-N-acetylmuramoyl-L-alanyl-D-glutamate--2,6-diaminopimelate ligase [Candidatus Omnitrophota bacterium]
MPKLHKLLIGVKCENKDTLPNANIESLSCNSKEIKKNCLFAALRGRSTDGHNYIAEAVSRGVRAVISEKDFDCPPSVIKIIVDNSRDALGVLLGNFYKKNEKLKLIGITGTNGKTTISLLINSILTEAGYETAVIGTLGYRLAGAGFKGLKNTTPGAIKLHSLLNEMKERSIGYSVMEVSSHALDQRRVQDLNFQAAIFSNLSRDHLDYHKNMKNYLAAKLRLFEGLPAGGIAVINRDDKVFEQLKKASAARLVTYAVFNKADFKAVDIKIGLNKSEFLIKTPSANLAVNSRLTGMHNVYNILAAASWACSEGISPVNVKRGIEKLKKVPGRLERVNERQQFKVFVDYAHTPDALEKVLGFLREMVGDRGKVITVFGCGGDRDRTKRPKMAKAAAMYSDLVIVTNDNPRREKPLAIFKDIRAGFSEAGFKKYKFMAGRRKAIETAFKSAQKNDVVLIAGKGHEKTQIFKNRTMPFDDVEAAKKILRKR